MYVDEKRQGEVAADPFKRSTLIAWLERKNPDELYCYIAAANCLLCQYFTDHGYSYVMMDPGRIFLFWQRLHTTTAALQRDR